MAARPISDIVEYASATPFATTLERLLEAIDGAGLTVFARIDHAAAARDVGLSMPPTVVLLYGNAKGGTPVMVAAPRMALDLPLRVLLRESANGMALLSYHPVKAALQGEAVPDELAVRLQDSQQVVLKALRP